MRSVLQRLKLGLKLNLMILSALGVLLVLIISLLNRSIDTLTLEMGKERVAQESAVLQSHLREQEQDLLASAKILASTPGLLEGLIADDEPSVRVTTVVAASRLNFGNVKVMNTQNVRTTLVPTSTELIEQENVLLELGFLGIETTAVMTTERGRKLHLAAIIPIRTGTTSVALSGVLLATREIDAAFLQKMNFDRQDIYLALISGNQIVQTYPTATNTLIQTMPATIWLDPGALQRTANGEIVISESLVELNGNVYAQGHFPLLVQATPVATVGVLIDMGRLSSFEQNASRNLSVSFVGLILMIAGIIALAVRFNISVPLQRLQAVVSQAEHGNYQQQANVSGADEVSQLAHSFNTMAAAIEHREAELSEAKQLAEEASRAKTEFLSRMSHELRTPLNAIMGFAQVLQLYDLTPIQQSNLASILKASRILLELINEVLDIARIEVGRFDLSIEPVAIHRIIEDVLEVMQPLAAERNVRLIDEIDQSAMVIADHQRLKQVLMNLCSNGIKYNRTNGSVTLRAETTADDQLKIMVSDTGSGIAETDLAVLFEPFTRVGPDQITVEGIGLGLTISKRFIEAMGGTIGVESQAGVGSTFWVSLRQALAGSSGSDTAAELSVLRPRPEIKATILYIEDNLSNLKLVQQVLALRPSIQLLSAMQGALGLDLARDHLPDLIFLDIHLPDLRGDAVLQRLQSDAQTRHIPVIILSADATMTQIQRLQALGAYDYLTKPLNIRQFLHVMDAVLSNHGATSTQGASS